MPDSTDSAIGELPLAEYIDDSDSFPMEQGGVAKHITGWLLKAFIDRNILDVRAQTLPEGSDVTASYNAETGILTLGIPRSLGAANSVDGVFADTSGDVPLRAVSYDRGQNLTDLQKARARENLGLQDGALAELPLSLENGGTGASSAAAARSSLGLANLVKVSRFTSAELAIASGAAGNVTVNCTEAGYTLMGILGIQKDGTASSQCMIYEYHMDNSNATRARAYFRNIGTQYCQQYQS